MQGLGFRSKNKGDLVIGLRVKGLVFRSCIAN